MNSAARLHALNILDGRVRAALRADDRVVCALAYGSRTQTRADGSPAADAWSDLEYYAFVGPAQTVDAFAFLRALTPVALAVVNPFGTPNVVTPELLRIELHIEPVPALEQVRGEALRAWELLNWVRGGLLQLGRLAVGAAQRQSPAKDAERDLPPALLAALNETVSGTAGEACHAALNLARDLAIRLNLDPRAEVLEALEGQLAPPSN